MLFRRGRLALPACLVSSIITVVNAVPSVNVALKTAFSAAPYILELLETAADENATSYFPLLDRIAEGYFDEFTTDKALYGGFRSLLQSDGHIVNPEGLSSFDFALSIRSAAPRIEAHYQYYDTSVEPSLGDNDGGGECDSWIYVPFTGQRWCSVELDEKSAMSLGKPGTTLAQLPFDRVIGDRATNKPTILYADIMSQSFRRFHETISRTAKEGRTNYRVRYKPSRAFNGEPLLVSGYGVELALKRTDYIVIDDRQTGEDKEHDRNNEEVILSDDEVSDLRPLTSSELRRLGLKAASFVMANEDQFEVLEQLSQDFPKYSNAISGMNISDEFQREHKANREELLPAGFNVIWINGVQLIGRDFDAYNMLDHLRRERKMINHVRQLGLTGPQAIDLLSHEAITESQVNTDVQRYDWRDDTEGGNVILWLNDLTKDKRYNDWPDSVMALLQRTYPGQLPSVKRDLHNLVVPVDLSRRDDVVLITETLQNFIKRKVPIRIGLVPYSNSLAGSLQAKIFDHILHTHGLATAMEYLTKGLSSAGRNYGMPQEDVFRKITSSARLLRNRQPLPFEEVKSSEELDNRLKAAQSYIARLVGAENVPPPTFVNGVPISRNDEWLQGISQRVGQDGRMVAQAVYENQLHEEDYLPDTFLSMAEHRRNPLIVPEDDKAIRQINLGEFAELESLPHLAANPDTVESELVHLTIAVDFDSIEGFVTFMEALLFIEPYDQVELAFLHAPIKHSSEAKLSARFHVNVEGVVQAMLGQYHNAIAASGLEAPSQKQRFNVYEKMFGSLPTELIDEDSLDATWSRYYPVVAAAGIRENEMAVLLNGRVVGPIEQSRPLAVEDFETLLSYERKKRLLPASAAIKSLGISDKAMSPAAFARISNLIALSLISDVPEGIFDATPTVRTSIFKSLNSSHTAIKVGDETSANIQIYAAIDPASETAQRWIPILRTLSELDGVYTCLYLNPKDRLEELPVKRFYRHVLNSKPLFDEQGTVAGVSAHFGGLPADALLNMGMDLPPSWLVAPKESVHDLDNIKLSAVRAGMDIEATYELEHILIEGHSRDVTLGPPPRGAQLVLATEANKHYEDTIIMSNLGYFQFKVNPGIYNLTLQEGRSQEIFNIDSAGTLGYAAVAGEDSTEIALMSFRGTTLFPRLSRKPGMEEEDVLESPKSAVEELAGKADKVLAQAGFFGGQGVLSKAAKVGASLLGSGKAVQSLGQHAEINIFSVASGHLYERMLNIMMLSVMKHTKHSVKFWFIEQFLSPSFKEFLPIVAAEYGFKYEMVTYKWPHWLRGQKEKQREIWGYKILFLDVLFPLDLDKVIFVDADQIVRTDMYELVQHDLKGAPYGFTPMCDSRTEMEGFRFWKQGYWKNFLRGLPYHISALYVVDLKRFRQIAAGDRLRQQYHQLSADPASLSNLDQDLPNHMQLALPIHSLPQEWLWCETWCSDESLKDAKTIDLCNNPQTKEPKLDRARRQVPEWTEYDNEIAAIAKRHREGQNVGVPVDVSSNGMEGSPDGESIQEQLQREDAEKEKGKQGHVRDEL